MDRGAGKLAIRERDLVFFCRRFEGLEMVGAHLVAKPPRTAVDHAADPALCKPECGRSGLIVDLADDLKFKEMVARSESAPLGDSPRPRFCRDRADIGLLHSAALFAPGKIPFNAAPRFHR